MDVVRAGAPGVSVPPLLRGLCDDAAVFPPGNTPLGEAVTAHRAHHDAWYGDLVGPFVVPAGSIPGIAPDAGPLRVVTVVPGPRAMTLGSARASCSGSFQSR